MCQKEWDRLKNGIMEGLKGHINNVLYDGRLWQKFPEPNHVEWITSNYGTVQYDDSDYDGGAVMTLAIIISSADDVPECKTRIESIMNDLGYALADPKPFAHSCDDGPIWFEVAFTRTIPMYDVTFALDEEEE